MKPFRHLAQARIPDGGLLTLDEHDGEFFLKLNGRQLMSTSATASELQLAKVACASPASRAKKSPAASPRLLIGGLGFGFTLKGVLDLIGSGATVHVAELLPEVVAWNREFLAKVNGPLLDDARVSLLIGDVFQVIRQTEPGYYDAIILDVDNGPVAMVQGGNSRLYDRRGLEMISQALKVGGRAVFWSASQDTPFVRRLSEAGFKVETFESKPHERAKRAAHLIYLAVR